MSNEGATSPHNESTNETKTANAPKTKLDSLNKEDLVRFVKKQIEHVKASKEEISSLKRERDELKEALKNAATKASSETVQPSVVNNLDSGDFEASELRIMKLNDEIAVLRSQLDDSRCEVQALKQSRATAEARSMELDDYEKKVISLTKELKELKTEHGETQEQIERLQEQLGEIEAERRKAEHAKEDLQRTIDNLREQVLESDKELHERGETLRETRAKLDALLEERHREGLELGSRLNEKAIHADQLESTVDDLRSIVTSATARAEEAEEQRRSIQKEFNEYKARAQYVLEQRNREKENDQSGEVTANKELIDGLKDEATRLNKVIESLQHSLALSEATNRDTSHTLKEREMELTETRRSLDDVRQRLQTRTEELKEARAALDSLSAHYRITTEKLQHTQLLLEQANLQSEKAIAARAADRESSTKRIHELEATIDELRKARDDALQALEQRKKNETSPQPHAPSTPTRTAVVLPQLSRWSEPPPQSAVDSRAASRISGEEDRSLEDVLFGREPQDECASLESKQDDTLLKQLAHTRELLNESEATNARLTDQTEFLKEEIRRMERDKERKEHLANTEYLKNVIMKFLTPERVAGERAQLLPVLCTMLRLSKEEMDILQKVADEDKVLEEKNPGAFGGYLHRWTGFS